MVVSLDIDDASTIRTKYHLLNKLIARYPKIKISLFWIPFDVEMEMGQLVRIYKEERLKELKELLATGNVELIPHGLTHFANEFKDADRYSMKITLKAIEETMSRDGLPYVKGFKAPFWLYNQDVVDVLDDAGWWMSINRDEPEAPRTKKYHMYNYSIHEPFWNSNEPVWKLHGHALGTDNDLEECFLNLIKIPRDAEFKFASELLEEREKTN